MKIVSHFSGDKSLIIWDALHRCLGYPFGAFTDVLSTDERRYCLDNGMNPDSNAVYGMFLSLLREPIRFAPDWNVVDGTKTGHNMDDTKDGYHHIIDFLDEGDVCLDTERIFNFEEEQSFMEWKPSNRTLLRVAPGFAVISARKRSGSCPQ